MIIRALDADGDWTFGRGQNNYLSGQAAVGLAIKTRLLCFLGDCFFDPTAGIDWFTLLGGSKDQLALNLAVSGMIITTPGVTGILELSINLTRQTRAITISYNVQTVYSAIANTFSYDLNG